MSEQDTFKDLAEKFQPMVDRLAREGMDVALIAQVFETYVRCKINNARNREDVDYSETSISMLKAGCQEYQKKSCILPR